MTRPAAALAAIPTLLALAPPLAAAPPAAGIAPSDRVYTADQFSNTVSVIDPSGQRLLGRIRLGDPAPAALSPLYRGQLLVHGMGFSPDGRTLVAVSVGSNSATFIDTATNAILGTTYVGRSPHEAFFTPDGSEVWVTVRGEAHVAVLSSRTRREIARIAVPNGPGMTIFSPDGAYAFICSSFTPETVVVDTRSRTIAGRVRQDSPFCPNIAMSPDGRQVWLTLKDIGAVMAFSARPPFALLKRIRTGPITNHVNFARNASGQFAYVTVGGENRVKVFRTDDFSAVAEIPVGSLPHGVWPSPDGSRVYVGLENGDAVAVIDTLANRVIAEIPVGQGPQAIAYAARAVPDGDGLSNLERPGRHGDRVLLRLSGRGRSEVALFDAGLVQVVQAAVAGLEPLAPYVLALAERPDGTGRVEPIAAFVTGPAGSAVVDTIGPIRRVVRAEAPEARRYLVVAPGTMAAPGPAVQLQEEAARP